MTIYILIILLMIVLSAFFSGSEISFNSANKLRLKKNAESGSKTADIAYRISEKFTTALSAILIGNNLANIAASTAFTIVTIALLKNVFELNESQVNSVSSVVSTVLMTLVILIFGEIIPKILAKQHADTVVRWVAYPVRILTIILYPLVAIVMLIINLLRKIWGKDKSEDEPEVTEEDLSSLIETVEEEGIIDEDKSELLQSTLEFPETTVEEIMTPRIDLVTIDIRDSDEKNNMIISSSRYSRIPVYDDSIDDMIGILSLNHYYRNIAKNSNVPLKNMLMPIYFIHKTMKLPNALKFMRERQTHLAIVIDEFGGTMGIVTMEDILEELVGDIWDESDEIIDMIKKDGDNIFIVNGDMNIYDFFDEIDFNVNSDFESEYSTVGGWAVEMLDADPHIGDSFTFENLSIVISEMDELRVTRLTVLVNDITDEES